MGWDERLRFNASDPPADGLAAMARELPGRPRAEVAEVRRLTGGVDAATHAVRLEPGGWVVVKRVRAPKAGSLAGELDRLAFARRVPVATPEPIALDVEGAWFGHPALVMGLVAGEAVFHPVIGDWIDQLAEALAAVHSTPLGDGEVPRALRDPHAGVAWQPAPASELARTAQVAALVEVGLSLRADLHDGRAGTVLLHHDFHHGNVLWRDGHVAGVLDWNEARLGPALCDVGYCSVDLAMTHGTAAADRFTCAYAAAAGTPLDDLARWQCLWTANAMRWIRYWITGFHESGIDIPLTLVRHRLSTFADDILSRV